MQTAGKLVRWHGSLRFMIMATGSDNQAGIEAALRRARSRWLTSAMVNAGGRWAVLPAGVAALLAIGLALAGVHSLALLLPLCLLSAGGALLALLLARRAYARPAAQGAPDWTLLLDRALGLNDALPTWLESRGEFRAALEPRIAAGLDPQREKLAAPARHWGALAVVVLLVMLPLAFWRPEPDPVIPEGVADMPQGATADERNAEAGPAAAGGGDASPDEPAPGSPETGGGQGDEGEVQQKPDGEKSEDGAGEAPEDVKPQPLQNDAPANQGGAGDQQSPPSEPPKPEDPEIDPNLEHVLPDAGEGETRTENRSRWVYNPHGTKLDESTPAPPDPKQAGEKAVPRTKLTTRERRLLQDLYRKLYE